MKMAVESQYWDSPIALTSDATQAGPRVRVAPRVIGILARRSDPTDLTQLSVGDVGEELRLRSYDVVLPIGTVIYVPIGLISAPNVAVAGERGGVESPGYAGVVGLLAERGVVIARLLITVGNLAIGPTSPTISPEPPSQPHAPQG